MASDEITLTYVGVGGHMASVTGERVRLGLGVERKRNWLWHFSLGYVSGFPVRVIFYYLITRHSTQRMKHWYWKREHTEFENATGQRFYCDCTPCRKGRA